MELGDAITAAVILAGSLYLLYRSLWKKKGCCSGCSSGACRPPRETAELVRLGQPRRAAAGGAASPRANG